MCSVYILMDATQFLLIHKWWINAIYMNIEKVLSCIRLEFHLQRHVLCINLFIREKRRIKLWSQSYSAYCSIWNLLDVI